MIRIAMTALVIALLALPCLAADEELSPELKVLGQRIGKWKTETVTKPGAWVPEGATSTGIETIEWTLGNKFIKGEAQGDGSRGKGSNMHLMTYDAQEGVYRFWYFDSFGNFPRGEMAGKWDENSRTMIWKGTLPNGVTVEMTMLIVDNDRVTWHAEWKNGEGKIMLEIDGKVTRVKDEKKNGK